MTKLLDIRTKIIELYRKGNFVIKSIVRAVLYFSVYYAILKKVGFNQYFNAYHIIVILAIVSAFLPAIVSSFLAVLYGVVHIYAVSPEIALLIVITTLVLYCFFVRFTTEYADLEAFSMSATYFSVPFFAPILAGIFGTPMMIIPVCTGIFAYYVMDGVQLNLSVIQNTSTADNSYLIFKNVVDSVVKNENMYVAMAISALVILVMCLIKNIKMDYSFEISLIAGTFIMMFVYIICMLRWDMGFGIVYIITMSLISGALAMFCYYMFRPLYYAASENIQFEDDEYFYYVKAVPKINISSSKTNVTRVISRLDDEKNEQDQE